jgi:hypothetical protein
VSELAREWWVVTGNAIEQAHRYGPGAQLGYQLILTSGLTFAGSVGVGYAVGARLEHVYGLAGIAIGYTGRRR